MRLGRWPSSVDGAQRRARMEQLDRMDLSNLNLNLLVHLEALLSCRSVSKAAEHLQLSQPTVSAALGQLRRHFGDDLLQRSGNRYELTPRRKIDVG